MNAEMRAKVLTNALYVRDHDKRYVCSKVKLIADSG